MSEKIIIAHDLGTSGDKAIAATVYGEILGEVKIHYSVSHPRPGWAEQDPEDLWNAVCGTTRAIIDKCDLRSADIAGIIFSSQTQCLVPVDEEGNPLRPLISWLDGRSADIINEKLWKRPRIKGYNIPRLLKFLRITGGAPGQTGKDQIGKLLWLKKYEPAIFNQAAAFLDAKDFILMRLCGQRVISADLAHIWWMMDTRNNCNQWHPDLCQLAGVAPDKLAEIRPSVDIIGEITPEAAAQTGLEPGIPVINGCGDLSAAALGSGALDDGQLHICLGTSGWVAGHMKKRKIDIKHYTGCIGSSRPDEYYLAMAHQTTVGICLEWLKDHVLYHKDQLLREYQAGKIYEILDELAETAPPGSEGLMFTPWMYGERSPLDDEFVRAGLFNVGLNHSREHIVRALFEGVALNIRWALETMENLYSPVRRLNIIGGGAKSDIWCQIMADITNREIHRVKDPQQAGARGMALLAGLSLGFLSSFQELGSYITIDRVFTPTAANRLLYDKLFKAFKQLYKQNKKWYKKMNHITEE